MSQTVSGIKENANKKKSGFGVKNGRMTRVKEVWSKEEEEEEEVQIS